MIIDGVNHGNTARSSWATSWQFKLLSLLFFANRVLGVPLRRDDATDLTYQYTTDPLMPPLSFEWPDYAENKKNYPFSAINPSVGYALSGRHVTGYKKNNFPKSCFDTDSLINQVLRKAVSESAQTVVDYTLNPCNTSYTSESNSLAYQSQIFGLSDDDCARYDKFYGDRAKHCFWRADAQQEEKEAVLTIVMILLGALVAASAAIALLLMFCRREQNSTAEPLLNARNRGVAREVEELAEGITSENFNALSADVQRFVREVQRSEVRVSNLTETQKNDLETANPALCDLIHGALLDIPVTLDGDAYELSSLIDIRPNQDGRRQKPARSGEFYELRDLQASRRLRGQVKSLIELHAPAQRGAPSPS